MARSHLMHSIMLALFITSQPALSAMPVTDAGVLAKAATQVNKLTEQIQKLGELKGLAQAKLDAIGKLGKITLPRLNVQKLSNQLKRDAQCLIPDLESLMPSVDFEDVELNSICAKSDFYKQTLLTPPDILIKQTWEEKEATFKQLTLRRETLLVDTATKALAQADQNIESAAELNDAADELQSSINGALTQQDRLAIVAQGQVAIVRAMAQQNQILAQMLKLQAAVSIKAGMPASSVLANTDEGKEK